MNWNPFRKKKKEEHVTEYMTVPLSTLLRNILYDSMINNPESLALQLGLPPISEDVSEMEAEASEARLVKISALLPLIEAHAQLSSEITMVAYAKAMPFEEGEEDEQVETLTHFFKLIALASSVSCLSTLVDLGLIETSVLELEVNGK